VVITTNLSALEGPRIFKPLIMVSVINLSFLHVHLYLLQSMQLITSNTDIKDQVLIDKDSKIPDIRFDIGSWRLEPETLKVSDHFN
jgi:hypothetical protein